MPATADRHVEAFLEMLAAERGSARNTRLAYEQDLNDFEDFCGRRGQAVSKADADIVRRTVEEHEVDEVVHFAAYKAVGESMENPGKYFANNVTGSQKLFEALHEAGVNRVVFSSTAAVYGTPARVPVRETDSTDCESVYAETKLMIEKTLGWYARTTDMRSVCLRYFNAAGASDDATLGENWRFSQNLVPHVMKAVLGHAPALKVSARFDDGKKEETASFAVVGSDTFASHSGDSGVGKVDQSAYDRAVKALGHVSITDVITLMGHYSSVAMTLAFYDVPDGAPGLKR